MGDVKMEGACNKPMRFDSYNEAERCRLTREREAGKPHKLIKWGACYEEGVFSCSPTRWEVAEFKECFDGAIFDDWIQPYNDYNAGKCSISLNNIEGGNGYHSELAQRNLIFRDSYKVTRTAQPAESSTLMKLTYWLGEILSSCL